MPSLLILSFATLLYIVLHSWLASLRAKAWALQHFGPRANRWYRLAYNLFAVISGLPILALLALLPDQPLYRIPFPWILLTGTGQLFGIGVIGMGIWQTDPWHFMGVRQILKPQAATVPLLEITGLYSRMRHPLYSGGLLWMWLFPFMSLNLLTIFTWLTIYLVVGGKLEEQRLIHEYGEAYRTYQRNVPMLIPRLWRGQ